MTSDFKKLFTGPGKNYILPNEATAIVKCALSYAGMYLPVKRLIWRLTSERLVRSVQLFVSVHYAVKYFYKSRTMCLFVSNEVRFSCCNLLMSRLGILMSIF